MTATVEAEQIVKTVVAKHGTVTLTETESGWEIRAVHSSRRVNGEPAAYTFRVGRCDCREKARAAYDEAMRKGGYATFGARRPLPICPKSACTAPHRREFDHCRNRGHIEKVRALFDDVVKSYERPYAPKRPVQPFPMRRTPRPDKREISDYTDWLAENDPTADNPFAS